MFRSLARIGYDGPIAFESFSSAVVDPVLSNMLGVWRNLWSDSYDLARHAKAFMEAQMVAAQARDGDAGVTFLGIDIGTSAVKAVLVDGEQQLLAEAEAPLAISRPQPLWSEQDPDAWWAATREVLAALRAAEPAAWAAVAGRSGFPARCTVPSSWTRPTGRCGRRSCGTTGARRPSAVVLAERVPDLGRIAGVPAMPGFTAPKLLWLAAHEPELFARIAKVLLPKDYVRLQLTGEHVTDPCDAAGTLWLDEARRAWSPEILAATGLTLAQMPRIVEGSVAGGRACCRAWPRRSACRPASRSRRAPAMPRRVRSASVPSTTATPSSRWAPRPSTSSPPPATGPIPNG